MGYLHLFGYPWENGKEFQDLLCTIKIILFYLYIFNKVNIYFCYIYIYVYILYRKWHIAKIREGMKKSIKKKFKKSITDHYSSYGRRRHCGWSKLSYTDSFLLLMHRSDTFLSLLWSTWHTQTHTHTQCKPEKKRSFLIKV